MAREEIEVVVDSKKKKKHLDSTSNFFEVTELYFDFCVMWKGLKYQKFINVFLQSHPSS